MVYLKTSGHENVANFLTESVVLQVSPLLLSLSNTVIFTLTMANSNLLEQYSALEYHGIRS